MRLEHLILIGGVLHLGLLLASASVPGTLNWRVELARLSPLSRQLVWVHGAFIVLVIVGFAALSLFHAGRLSSGDPLARFVCGFVAVFWLGRLAVQCFVFDAKPHLTRPLLTLAYRALTLVFIYLALVYGLACVAPRLAGGGVP